ncbi:MAG: potassium/proton antiporter [Acidimicrobiia bacterium]|nr:potassium/proton antiporter [Acidimicrobiia bacterium]MCC5954363.1 potassium/proton antiporter [Acidimicrobiia bacterium]
MSGFELSLAAGAALLLLGVAAAKGAHRFGVPALLIFVGIGMLAGSDGLGGIEFTDMELARSIGVVALAYILFSGGLDTRWSTVRPVLAPGVVLATVGVAVTAGIVGVVAAWALDVPLATGLLLGAIVASTDAAAVFSVLRTRSVGLRSPIRPLLELESGSNDPMAVFLTIGLLALVVGDIDGPAELLPLFFLQMGLGAVGGVLWAKVGLLLINKLRLEDEGLYPVMTLALVALTYGSVSYLGGSGFLAVYVAGIVMANSHFVHERSLIRFHDALAWLMQIVMFGVLGLLAFPSQFPDVALRALIVAVALVVVARPVAVVLSLLPFRLGWRANAMVSWVGLRGAVPIILASFPLVEGIPEAATIFNVVFFVVLVSVAVQGTTIPAAAKLFGVATPVERKPSYPIEATAAPEADTDLRELVVPEGSAVTGRRVFELGLPPGALIVLVNREGVLVVPRGATDLLPGDRLMVLADDDGFRQMAALLEPSTTDPADEKGP